MMHKFYKVPIELVSSAKFELALDCTARTFLEGSYTEYDENFAIIGAGKSTVTHRAPLRSYADRIINFICSDADYRAANYIMATDGKIDYREMGAFLASETEAGGVSVFERRSAKKPCASNETDEQRLACAKWLSDSGLLGTPKFSDDDRTEALKTVARNIRVTPDTVSDYAADRLTWLWLGKQLWNSDSLTRAWFRTEVYSSAPEVRFRSVAVRYLFDCKGGRYQVEGGEVYSSPFLQGSSKPVPPGDWKVAVPDTPMWLRTKVACDRDHRAPSAGVASYRKAIAAMRR